MMMITLMSMMLTALTYAVKEMKDPMKMCILLTITTAYLSVSMCTIKDSSWFPWMFYMLFMGGIMIMFMILSALVPNTSSKKMKMNMILSSIIVVTIFNPQMSYNYQTKEMVKWFLQNSSNTIILTMVMLIYFSAFILVITSSKMNLRSTICYWKSIL